MDATNRARACAQLMRDLREDFHCLKVDLQEAIDGIDDYFTANATAINNAIPATARAALTTSQKAVLVGYVALRRAGKLKAEED